MRHGAASTQQLEDVVLVDGVVHRLAHQHVAERPIVGRRRVHRQVRDRNLLEHEDPIVVVGVLPEARDHAGRDRIAHDVELICLDLLNGRVCVDPHAELDPRVGGRIAPVVRVEHEGGALADRAGFEQVRPGADRRLAECLGVIGGQIRRDDGRERHGQDVEEREIGIGDRDLDRVIVDGDEPGRLVGLTIHDGLPALDQRVERAADRRGRRSQVRAEQPIEREDDVVGRHLAVHRAIGRDEVDALVQRERVRQSVVRDAGHVSRKQRDELGAVAVGEERLEDQSLRWPADDVVALARVEGGDVALEADRDRAAAARRLALIGPSISGFTARRSRRRPYVLGAARRQEQDQGDQCKNGESARARAHRVSSRERWPAVGDWARRGPGATRMGSAAPIGIGRIPYFCGAVSATRAGRWRLAASRRGG